MSECLINLNATQAAIRAGYSAAVAKEIGYENLTKPHIADAIVKAQSVPAGKCGVNALWVLRGAKAVYERARASGKLGETLSALKLIGTHIEFQIKVRPMAQALDHTLASSDKTEPVPPSIR